MYQILIQSYRTSSKSIFQETPEWFLSAISNIISSESVTPVLPPLKFELSHEAATHNMKILKACGDSIQNLIKKCPGSIISPGSEFRHPDLLESLFLHHHNWPVVKQILEVGSMWPLDPITEIERQAKNIEFIHRGNHKSAIKYDAEYKKILTTEINQGWMFPVPLQYINKIHHGELAPIGIDD